MSIEPQRQQQRMYVTQTSDKNRTVAFLLCLFLGVLGAHEFYVGKMGMGILYFLTLGLFGIGWLISILSIVTGNFKDNVGAPLRQW